MTILYYYKKSDKDNGRFHKETVEGKGSNIHKMK
jgi:hypothetical protein